MCHKVLQIPWSSYIPELASMPRESRQFNHADESLADEDLEGAAAEAALRGFVFWAWDFGCSDFLGFAGRAGQAEAPPELNPKR